MLIFPVDTRGIARKGKSHGAQKAYGWLGLFTQFCGPFFSVLFFFVLFFSAPLTCLAYILQPFYFLDKSKEDFEMNTYFLSTCGQSLRVIGWKELPLWLF